MGKRLQICEVISDLEHLKEEDIVKAIERNGDIREWAYILHDKDVREDGTAKNSHWHIELRLSNGREIRQIANWFGVAENFVNECKSKSPKSYKYNDMLAYLIHAGDKTKHQYDISEIKTNVKDIEERIKDYRERMNGKPMITKKLSEETIKLNEIINQITEGQIREYNITDFVDGLMYSKHTREIKAAFDYRRTILQGMEREMEVYFFCGESGSGKTSYAKQIAKNNNYSFYVSSSQNDVLDGYAGQDVIILDDLRPKSFELADLLKFLDNNTNSTVKSRYHNKVIEAKVIIITSIFHIEDFFNMTGKEERGDEPITQFKRRCKLYAIFNNQKIKTFIYNEVNQEYEDNGTFDNPINKKFPKLAPTAEQRERYRSIFTIDIIDDETENKTENENKNKEEPVTVKPLRMQQNPHDDGYSDEELQLMLPFY